MQRTLRTVRKSAKSVADRREREFAPVRAHCGSHLLGIMEDLWARGQPHPECLAYGELKGLTGSSSTASTATSPGMCTCQGRAWSASKFWLVPVALARNEGFSPRELNRIRALVLEHVDRLVEARDEHCSG